MGPLVQPYTVHIIFPQVVVQDLHLVDAAGQHHAILVVSPDLVVQDGDFCAFPRRIDTSLLVGDDAVPGVPVSADDHLFRPVPDGDPALVTPAHIGVDNVHILGRCPLDQDTVLMILDGVGTDFPISSGQTGTTDADPVGPTLHDNPRGSLG